MPLPAVRPGWVDLAARSLGGSVVAANDESFGAKESLLVDGPPVFAPGRYGHVGELVDGWETRRRRSGPGQDWALVRLGAPGVVRSVDVDTSHFTGNHPARCLVEACLADGYPDPAELEDAAWRPVVPWRDLRGDAHNVFAVDDPLPATHVRLTVEPDGGVARLRVHGEAAPDPRLVEGLTVDLLDRALGGAVLAGSDEFYTRADALNAPGPARTMGEGWETRRRRDGGHDWALLQLAAPGRPAAVEVDTSWFVHNATREVELWGCRVPEGSASSPPPSEGDPAWRCLLPAFRLQPDTRHVVRLASAPETTHVRLVARPDGGLARLRLPGHLTEAGLAVLRARRGTR